MHLNIHQIKKFLINSYLSPQLVHFIQMVLPPHCVKRILHPEFVAAEENIHDPLPPLTIEQLLSCPGRSEHELSKTFLFLQ